MSGIVACTLLWPLAHASLVARYRIDPWELFGWSMYALPPARVQVRVEVERGGETKALRPMRELRRQLRDFARRRTALGSLVSSEPLARAILAEDATIDALTIWTREIRLDPESTRLVARDEAHRHDRNFSD